MGNMVTTEFVFVLLSLVVTILPVVFGWKICRRLKLPVGLAFLNLFTGLGTLVFLGILAYWLQPTTPFE